ncbi:MAG TPA: LysR substrate-binding domain-containing protein [Pseudolabrys sp.]|nr:LysR substrate-binding domain-containing protein [Pseudolabrys sp.]
MTNIPTDLLRTLVAVVDLRSYTKAANSLGVTQPAVSAQIKRLQQLIGADLFERSGQGVSLTARGERVLARARRLLSLNDEIVGLGGTAVRSDLTVRIGTPSDFVASVLPPILGRFRAAHPDVRFIIRSDFYDPLLRQLHMGEIDLLFGLSPTRPADARHCEAQEMLWVCGEVPLEVESGRPVPLVSCGEPCTYHRHAVKTLRGAGLDYEQIFLGATMHSLNNAVAAGLGTMICTRRRASVIGLTEWEDCPLPKPAPLHSAIHVREGGARETYEQLADHAAAVLHGPVDVQERVYATFARPRSASSAA